MPTQAKPVTHKPLREDRYDDPFIDLVAAILAPPAPSNDFRVEAGELPDVTLSITASGAMKPLLKIDSADTTCFVSVPAATLAELTIKYLTALGYTVTEVQHD